MCGTGCLSVFLIAYVIMVIDFMIVFVPVLFFFWCLAECATWLGGVENYLRVWCAF